MNSPQSIYRYTEHLRATLDWLLLSIEEGHNGSSAHYSPLGGWSAPYPETTGYIIPTLLEAAKLPAPPAMQGQSLLRIARERMSALRTQAESGLIPRIVLTDNQRLIVSRELAVVQARRRFEAAGLALSLFLRDAGEKIGRAHV